MNLIAQARAARERAYAPYSGYAVGAAIEDELGRVHVGCNVENISYGVTLCAERTAVGAMVTAGGKRIRRVAVSTRDAGTPCGLCLQTLLEFTDDPAQVEVTVGSEDGSETRYTLSDLIPHGFRSANVDRTERPQD